MKRSAPYAEDSPSHYAASQMQQHSRINNYSGRPDSLSIEQGQPRMSSRVEDPRQWGSSAPTELNSVPSHLYPQGQGSIPAQSFPDGRADQNPDGEQQVNSDPRLQSYEQDMEIGYDEKPPPLTFEGLEKKFQNEIMKLVKELNDAEDVENARHREKIVEINNQYQERLLSLRSQQVKRREEFLQKESLERLHTYQQSGIVSHPSEKVSNDSRLYHQSGTDNHPIERIIPTDPRSYQQAKMGTHQSDHPIGNHPREGVSRDPRVRAGLMGAHQSDPRSYQQAGIGNRPNQRDPRIYGQRGQNESYREQSEYHGERRSERTQGRVPYPQGRAYNNASDLYH